LYKNTYSLDRYPLSLGYLSAAIKKETDWEVLAYNADFHLSDEYIKISFFISEGFSNYLNNLKDLSMPIWGEIKSVIYDYKPDVVGISAKSQNFNSACNVAKLVKMVNRKTVVIVGGPHVSMIGADILSCPEIDIGVKGEGEKTIVELLDSLSSNKELSSIKGIIYRDCTGVVENAPRDFIKDLDLFGYPHEFAAEVLKDYDKYPITAFNNIFASRGCPYSCFFCGSKKIWGQNVRFRSPENIVKEINLLQEKGIRFIRFDDDTFGVKKQNIIDLCNAISKHCPGVRWSCELHVKLVDEQVVRLMRKSGCYRIEVGIESGNNEMLKKIRKNITIEEAILACKIIKKYGIELQTFFMVGFPWETESTLEDTLNAMKNIDSDILAYSIFTPYPGTEAFEFCKVNRLIDDKFDTSLYNHQSPANHFCLEMSAEKLRIFLSKIERIVDRKNLQNRVKRIFYLSTFKKIQELGIKESFKKAINILSGR
jgi:radical SAM superfamily enzyme YgiQ (UPF0313 family)